MNFKGFATRLEGSTFRLHGRGFKGTINSKITRATSTHIAISFTIIVIPKLDGNTLMELNAHDVTQ